MTQHCGFVAVVGAPNAGKSTLVNALVGQKVAIVSPKAQTTRTRLMGVAMEGDTQIILIDTPGIFAPNRRLDRAMVAAAWGSLEEAEAILVMVDAAAKLTGRVERVLEGIANRPEKKYLILNKVDLTKKDKLLTIATELNAKVAFDETYFISASSGDGVAELKANLAALIQQRGIQRKCRESGVAAEDAGHDKQSPWLRGIALEGEIAGDQAHDDRTRDVDDEGAEREMRSECSRADRVDRMPQARAEAAAQKHQNVVHRLPLPHRRIAIRPQPCFAESVPRRQV